MASAWQKYDKVVFIAERAQLQSSMRHARKQRDCHQGTGNVSTTGVTKLTYLTHTEIIVPRNSLKKARRVSYKLSFKAVQPYLNIMYAFLKHS